MPDSPVSPLTPFGKPLRTNMRTDAEHPASRKGTTEMTGAETACWSIFTAGIIVGIIAGVMFSSELGRIGGNPQPALLWLYVGGALAGCGLTPGLILTGMRQLLLMQHFKG